MAYSVIVAGWLQSFEAPGGALALLVLLAIGAGLDLALEHRDQARAARQTGP